jgi:hypothetical protein
MFILIAQDCVNCGNNTAIRCFKKQPSDEDIHNLNIFLGGNLCISNYVTEYCEGDEEKDMKLL